MTTVETVLVEEEDEEEEDGGGEEDCDDDEDDPNYDEEEEEYSPSQRRRKKSSKNVRGERRATVNKNTKATTRRAKREAAIRNTRGKKVKKTASPAKSDDSGSSEDNSNDATTTRETNIPSKEIESTSHNKLDAASTSAVGSVPNSTLVNTPSYNSLSNTALGQTSCASSFSNTITSTARPITGQYSPSNSTTHYNTTAGYSNNYINNSIYSSLANNFNNINTTAIHNTMSVNNYNMNLGHCSTSSNSSVNGSHVPACSIPNANNVINTYNSQLSPNISVPHMNSNNINSNLTQYPSTSTNIISNYIGQAPVAVTSHHSSLNTNGSSVPLPLNGSSAGAFSPREVGAMQRAAPFFPATCYDSKPNLQERQKWAAQYFNGAAMYDNFNFQRAGGTSSAAVGCGTSGAFFSTTASSAITNPIKTVNKNVPSFSSSSFSGVDNLNFQRDGANGSAFFGGGHKNVKAVASAAGVLEYPMWPSPWGLKTEQTELLDTASFQANKYMPCFPDTGSKGVAMFDHHQKWAPMWPPPPPPHFLEGSGPSSPPDRYLASPSHPLAKGSAIINRGATQYLNL